MGILVMNFEKWSGMNSGEVTDENEIECLSKYIGISDKIHYLLHDLKEQRPNKEYDYEKNKYWNESLGNMEESDEIVLK